MGTKILHGNCLEVLTTLPDNSIDSIVTDPPYELGFMGKKWDATGIAYNVDLWEQCLRVLKPGGHLLAFGGTRTYHRMAVAIEDAGFEIRDSIHWIYGSGFPKSMDISKAIDKQAGHVRSDRIVADPGTNKVFQPTQHVIDAGTPVTDEAKQWEGWGTALKPAHEPIVMARKPVEGTVADNVIKYGTGALNIEETRIPSNDGFEKAWDRPVRTNIGASGGNYISNGVMHTIDRSSKKPSGRFPANVLFDEDAAQELDGQETGGPSRFFYVAKPSKKERNAGVEHLEEQQTTGGGGPSSAHGSIKARQQNFHPTVKPIELMRYLCRMVTPPGGVVLDPFAGSGTTLVAATLEGFNSVGIEMTEEYLPIIEGRVEWAKSQKSTAPKSPAKKKSKVKIKVKKKDVPSLF